MAKTKRSTNLFQLNTSTYLLLGAMLVIGFFLGAQFMESKYEKKEAKLKYSEARDMQISTKNETLDEVEPFVVALIRENQLKEKEGYTPFAFEREGVNTNGEWILGTVTSEVLQPDTDAHFTPWDLYYFVGKRLVDKKWIVALQGTDRYTELIDEMPESFLPASSKEAFR